MKHYSLITLNVAIAASLQVTSRHAIVIRVIEQHRSPSETRRFSENSSSQSCSRLSESQNNKRNKMGEKGK